MAGEEQEEEAGGQGHPLPDSAEAREEEIPEHLVREKGHGDDAHARSRAEGDAVAPDGEHYEIRPAAIR
ncbi:MAG: hypothetical protein QOJ53_240 [Sphingomonadales bacterium]|jgi:hypothetical protein|nr:hypothetical protein [Sphingomonadales bacterium]